MSAFPSPPSRLQALRRRADGFTLIELLVVMMIMGIGMAIAIPVFTAQRKKALAEQGVSGGLPTPDPTVVTSPSEAGGSFPWVIVLAVLGLFAVGGWLFVMAQINKAKDAEDASDASDASDADLTEVLDDADASTSVSFDKSPVSAPGQPETTPSETTPSESGPSDTAQSNAGTVEGSYGDLMTVNGVTMTRAQADYAFGIQSSRSGHGR